MPLFIVSIFTNFGVSLATSILPEQLQSALTNILFRGTGNTYQTFSDCCINKRTFFRKFTWNFFDNHIFNEIMAL